MKTSSMPIWLWLDDKREAPEGWTRAYTADEAIAILRTGRVSIASLDHDLGHCDACQGCKGYESRCGCRCHLHGSFVVNWMATEAVWPPNGVRVHSRNPKGAEYMAGVIARYGPYCGPHPSHCVCKLCEKP